MKKQKGRYKDGNNVSYKTFHSRVRRARGVKRFCDTCKTTTAKKYEWANKTGHYEDINDYIRLCTSCHLILDKRTINFYKFKITKCIRCGKKFQRKSSNHPYCGNRKQKTGCSYKNFNEYHLKRYHVLSLLKNK